MIKRMIKQGRQFDEPAGSSTRFGVWCSIFMRAPDQDHAAVGNQDRQTE
jgi:hypothetical protein